MSDNIKTIAVVRDTAAHLEAMYVDGNLAVHGQIIYANDIAAVQNGDPIVFRYFKVKLPASMQWPPTLDKALEHQS